MKWEGEETEKNWKIYVERTAGESGSGRFKTKAEEGRHKKGK